MGPFRKIVTAINTKHAITNARVLKNLSVLETLAEAKGPIVLDNEYSTFGVLVFLNRKGLLKYKKEGTNKVKIYPTLLFYYLTLVMKYDIYTVYQESIKLYRLIGDKLNDIKQFD